MPFARLVICLGLLLVSWAQALPAQDRQARLEAAARLGGELTPLGAERAGNGSDIPDWRGGVRMPPPGYPAQQSPAFGRDAAVLTINGQNWREYAAFLTPGLQALLRQHPSLITLNIYPTRRTAAAPEAVYDAAYRNAVRVDSEPATGAPLYARAAIPFPLPMNGQQVIWNHLARWQGLDWQELVEDVQVVNGSIQHLRWQLSDDRSAYYERTLARPAAIQELGTVTLASADLTLRWHADTRIGGQWQQQGIWPAGWKADLPMLDERDMFSGSVSLYQWQLLGIREFYVPYNVDRQGLPVARNAEVPEMATIRFEKHRLLVVDGILRKGVRHPYHKRVFYIDPDSSQIILADMYDNNGRLWRTGINMPMLRYEAQALVSGGMISLDLLDHSYALVNWPVDVNASGLVGR